MPISIRARCTPFKERFQPDGLFCLMDLSVEAGALGLEVLFPEMDTPTVVEHPVRTRADLERLSGRRYSGRCAPTELCGDGAAAERRP